MKEIATAGSKNKKASRRGGALIKYHYH